MSETYYNESSYPSEAEEGTGLDLSEAEERTGLDLSEAEKGTGFDLSEAEEGTGLDMASEVACCVCSLTLLDPMTLSCGHSFCRHCLARLWHSKSRVSVSNLLCPSCRQPWAGMPAINIQLRNIVEGVYGDTLSQRREAISSEDAALIRSFSKAAVRRPVDNRPYFMIGGLLLLGALCIVLVLLSAVFVWVMSGPTGEFMRKPVNHWTSRDVLSWVEGLGEWTLPNITGLFQVQALTGPQLLLVDNEALEGFGIDQPFRRQTILQAVRSLQAQQFSSPLDFYQFKAAHRKTTLLVALFYGSYPRLTLIYSYLFEYYNIYLPLGQVQFSSADELSRLQNIVLTVLLWLLPHLGVGVLAFNWLYQHPWIVTPTLVHCTHATMIQALSLLRTPWRRVLTLNYIQLHSVEAVWEAVRFTVYVSSYSLLWHAVPHFICDLLFYLALWQTITIRLIIPFVKYVYKLFA
ncbi:bifunctional apoptosis regulator-like isoform X2 [Halichondria panicea]|uniref:bifunctional apoptosis regulator-like isoform X2 n=1 Tax=Halichondria panicea TaxID=6063 RepID=UPI00312B317A